VDQAWQKELRWDGGGWHRDGEGGRGGVKAETEGWGGHSAGGRRALSSDANPPSSTRGANPAPQPCSCGHKGFSKGKTQHQDGSLNMVPSSSAEVYYFGVLALHFYMRVSLEQGRPTSMPSPPKAFGS